MTDIIGRIIRQYDDTRDEYIVRTCKLQRVRLDFSPECSYIIYGHCNIYAYIDPLTQTIVDFDCYYSNNNQKN
jgi:hypothetical protein